MGKLTCWTLTIALLCSWSQFIYGNNSLPQYRSVGINSEDKDKIALFVLYVVISEYGKKLDKGYKCPVYCGVRHKHIYWENHEVKKSNIQTADGLYITARDTAEEQSASSLRSVTSTD